MIKRIDDSYRILIPQEIRQQLKINKNDSFDISIEDNKIILVKQENDLDLNLRHKKVKSTLQQEIDSVPYNNNYWKEEEITDNTDNTDGDELSDVKCAYCDNMVEVSRLDKIKVNGNPLCKKCCVEFKKKFTRDILYLIRLKRLNDD